MALCQFSVAIVEWLKHEIANRIKEKALCTLTNEMANLSLISNKKTPTETEGVLSF